MNAHRFILSILFFTNLFVSAACSKKTVAQNAQKKEVVIYTYDSFMSEWGPGSAIASGFEKATGFSAVYVNCGDGAQILSKAVLEKNKVQADVLLGIDNNLIHKAKKENVLTPFKPEGADDLIPSELSDGLGGDWLLTPYDWSKFAIIYDTQSNTPAPKSLKDLTKPEYAKKLILMDPRTSTPGLGFAAWTIAVFGSDYERYWQELKPSVLTMASGWSSGYGLFTKGEAPLVVSYVTSPAYHVYADKTNRYRALIFGEGHVEQIEGAGIVKGAPNTEGAKAFIAYLIGSEAQNAIPLTQWMYPANKTVVLPECYALAAPAESKTLTYDALAVEKAVPHIIEALGK